MDNNDTLNKLDYQAKTALDTKRSHKGTTNLMRAERAEEMLRCYIDITAQVQAPLPTMMVCALTDFMHFCRMNEVDFEEALQTARERHARHAAGDVE